MILPYLFHPIPSRKNKICCISAGAAKGFYQLGALHYLDSIGECSQFTVFVGSSVGAAISCMLAIGYEPLEFFSYTCTNDINECFKYDLNIGTILQQWGAIDIQCLKQYIESAILHKIGFIPTFEELYLQFHKCFICTAWCINSPHHQTYFNPFETPHVKISDAVIASCALPGIFTKMYIGNKCYIDGGLFDRLPVYYAYQFCIKYHIPIELLTIIDGKSTYFKVNESIPSVVDYLKGMLYIPFFMQPEINKEKLEELLSFVWITLECEHAEITLSLDVKDRINNFCNGFSQAKRNNV